MLACTEWYTHIQCVMLWLWFTSAFSLILCVDRTTFGKVIAVVKVVYFWGQHRITKRPTTFCVYITRYVQWRHIHGERGHVPPTFTNGRARGDTVSRRTANRILTKLYWPSQKRSPKRLIVLLEPKIGVARPPLSNSFQCHWILSDFQIYIVILARLRKKVYKCLVLTQCKR